MSLEFALRIIGWTFAALLAGTAAGFAMSPNDDRWAAPAPAVAAVGLAWVLTR